MYSGNKGEWSEFYTFLKLLADGLIYGADQDLNKVADWVYPIINIKKVSTENKDLTFTVMDEIGAIEIKAASEENSKNISQNEFRDNAMKLLESIKNAATSSFSVEEIQPFIDKIEKPKIKERSQSKRDITVTIKDLRLHLQQEVGFSIKSKLGGASTLFNAGNATNFTFEVLNFDKLSHDLQQEASNLKTMKLVKWLNDHGCSYNYIRTTSEQLYLNFLLIDSELDTIFANLMLEYYSGNGSSVEDYCKEIELKNPCNYPQNLNQSFYKYKIKQFLSACALGLTPTTPWDGEIDATGGYIVVKKDGEMVCYHIYNWNAFQEYLFKNTRLETASTSRYNFGKIYKEKDKYYLQLNLQIRFK